MRKVHFPSSAKTECADNIPIKPITNLVTSCCFIQTPPWSVPWYIAVEHTLAAAIVNASQKIWRNTNCRMPKAFSKLSQIQYFTFESARISLKWTIKILLTMVTQRYRPQLFSQTDDLLIFLNCFNGEIHKVHRWGRSSNTYKFLHKLSSKLLYVTIWRALTSCCGDLLSIWLTFRCGRTGLCAHLYLGT